MVRDERRFKKADRDGDLTATKEEFTAFLHPEEYDYMKDIVVQVGSHPPLEPGGASPMAKNPPRWPKTPPRCQKTPLRLAGDHGGHR